MPRWIVVGGGAAGCVVAGALSGRPDADVVLCEAGPDHGADPVVGDVGPYLTDPGRIAVAPVVRRRGGAAQPYLQGFGLGGSSLVNGTVVTDPSGAPDALPLEAPWAHGEVAAALLASDPSARPVTLVRDRGVRRTAADIFLRPHLGRPNLELRCGAEVERVRLARGRAIGVELTGGDTIDGDRVVVCAGAINTPALLLRSGVDTPGIGAGLQDHPAFTFALALRDGVVDTSVPVISVAATHSRHQIIALDHLPEAPSLGALTVGLLDVRSEGHVTIGPDGEVRVELDQLEHRDDRRALVDGVAATVRLLHDRVWEPVVAAVYVDDEGTPLGEIAAADLADWVIDHAGGHYHVSASCHRALDAGTGAVVGYDGLFVADASALGRVPRLDPYVAVVRQAERLAAAW